MPSAPEPNESESKSDQTGFPIVGIGASAGGLTAFEAFFSGMPPDKEPGMAFVLVQHLAPDYKSILSDLIQRSTPMEVFEVEDGMQVRPNCVYIIPPNRDMVFLNGNLRLLKPKAARGLRLPIDFFFRSLADDQHERAIAIVLSGTGSDGTQGIKAIKGAGGIVMIQEPDTADFDGMPRSALATGLVDYHLAPTEMARQLIAYVTNAHGHAALKVTLKTPKTKDAMRRVFVLLRAQTGHDFSQYKPGTIERRVDRRMAVHQIENVESYVKYLEATPEEMEALYRDLLIGVTHFFRDAEAFAALEKQVIPNLIVDKLPGAVIRVWVAGCSTGEEAYSIAILLKEQMERLKQHHLVQVFATDIDDRAITFARTGRFSEGIASDISPERLAHFFTLEPGGGEYRINKNIRDILVFSKQDLIKDPPFSKVDLISCRNLLIYFGTDLQKKVIPLFHYALKPDGILFLGNSEGLGEMEELFTAVDRKAKIFRRKEDYPGMHRMALGRFLPPMTNLDPSLPTALPRPQTQSRVSVKELTEQTLLQQIPVAAVLVNAKGDILYLHGRTGMFLEPAPGEAGTNNILKMAREGLRLPLSAAIQKAASEKTVIRNPGLPIKTNGHFTSVNLTICPVAAGTTGAPHLLVILQESSVQEGQQIKPTEGAALAGGNDEPNVNERIEALHQELLAKDEYLKSAQNELERSNEELKSSNEEMQSVNEELQSTNEELETSKEELQSVNEELATVNTELQTKVTDLSRAYNDMNNLLAGTDIGTVFVNHQLRILRFTPAVTQIINLIPEDVGRPVAHFASNLIGYDTLIADVQSVLATLKHVDVDVRTVAERWFTMHIQPYRTLENVIEGAVISFVDITERRKVEEELLKANELVRLAAVVRDAHDAVTVHNLEGRILAWNPGAERLYGWSEAEALKMNIRDRIPEGRREEAVEKIHSLSRSEILEPYLTQRMDKSGRIVEVSIIATSLLNAAGILYAVATTERKRDAQES